MWRYIYNSWKLLTRDWKKKRARKKRFRPLVHFVSSSFVSIFVYSDAALPPARTHSRCVRVSTCVVCVSVCALQAQWVRERAWTANENQDESSPRFRPPPTPLRLQRLQTAGVCDFLLFLAIFHVFRVILPFSTLRFRDRPLGGSTRGAPKRFKRRTRRNRNGLKRD